MVTAPVLMPVTTPAEFTVALAVLLLDHVPPPTVAVSVTDDPVQTVLLPLIAAPAVTVTIRTAAQPLVGV